MSMKKMAAVLLAVVMMLCLLPTAAFAVDEVRVYVGGCGYLNDGTTSCGEGTVTLNRAEKTLTIENIETSMLYIYGVGDDFTLIVKGENKLEITNSAGGVLVYSVDVPTQKIVLEENAVLDVANNDGNAIYVNGGDLEVRGAGLLKLSHTEGAVSDYPVLAVYGDLTVADGVSLTIDSSANGIWAQNIVFDGATVDITADMLGIFSVIYDDVADDYIATTVTMRNSTVDIDVTAGDEQAVCCQLGFITIEDTVLTTKTSMAEDGANYALYVDGDLLIKGDKTDVKHTGGIGFSSDSGTITIEGGKVDVKSNDTALLGYRGVTISGGVVKAESTNSYAILGTKGTVSITGADTEVTAITGSEDYAAIGNSNNPDVGDGGIHLDAKITVQGMNLIVGLKKDAEAAITLGENFEIAGATLKHESIDSSKTKTYFVDAEGNALTGEAVVCKHTYGETPTWTWAEDGSSATASFPCTASGDYTEVVNATITSQTTPATCVATGKTVYTAKATFGGKEYTSTKEITIAIDADAHGETELKNAKDATCTEKGYTGDKVCKDCGKTVETGQEIEMKAHGETELKNVKEATCAEEGYTGDKVCKVCGEVVEQGKPVEKLAHSYKDGKCTVCGAVDPNYVPVTPDKPDSDSPQTGDNSNMVLWIALLFVSGTGLFGITAYSRKKRAR